LPSINDSAIGKKPMTHDITTNKTSDVIDNKSDWVKIVIVIDENHDITNDDGCNVMVACFLYEIPDRIYSNYVGPLIFGINNEIGEVTEKSTLYDDDITSTNIVFDII
jgi:hypothetical protein